MSSTENKIPELDKLFTEVGKYRNSEDLKKLLDFVKKFRNIALFNAMLLHVQKPGSQYVASATEWKGRFGRDNEPGATPLVILRPFGPVAFVFELGDTYGKKPFSKELLNPFKAEGEVSDVEFSQLIRNLKCDGIAYTEADHGTSSAGFAIRNTIKREVRIPGHRRIVWVRVLCDIVVNKNQSRTTRFATVLHELAHIYCGHLGTPNAKWWSDRHSLDICAKEFEAESVCWLVSERMGIMNPSAQYLSRYLDENEQIPMISLHTVLKSVGIIESMIRESKTPRRDMITKTVVLKGNTHE